MLTLDLVRNRIRVSKGMLRPRYVDVQDEGMLELAREIIELFELHVGQTFGELKEATSELLGEGSDAQLGRGLFKLLEDRTSLELDGGLDPRQVRERVFEAAARWMPVLRHHATDLQLELPGESGEGATLPAETEYPAEPEAPAGSENPVVSENPAGSESPAAGEATPAAAEVGPVRRRVSRWEVLAEVAVGLESTPAAVETALYADLPEARLVGQVRSLSPRELLERYNLGLAQALLLRAGEMRVAVWGGSPARYRQLFRWIKFFRLMHTVEERPEGGLQIRLDGPTSLFRLSQKYGLQFASFLPALLLCEHWRLETEVEWGGKKARRPLVLSPGDGLRSFYPDTGAYTSREEQWFEQRFAQLKTEWQLERAEQVVSLEGQGLLIPDYVLRHPDGRQALVEVVGFWRKSYLERRLQLYRLHGPSHLILVVSRALRGSLEGLELEDGRGFAGALVFFREMIIPREVLAAAERVARFELVGEGGEASSAPGPAVGATPKGLREQGDAAAASSHRPQRLRKRKLS